MEAGTSVKISVTANVSIHAILVLMYGNDKVITSSYPGDLDAGLEAGHFLVAIKSILEPTDKQFIKVLTPSGEFCQFGISHEINSKNGDEIGDYVLELEDIDPNYSEG